MAKTASEVLSEIYTGSLPDKHYRQVLSAMESYASQQNEELVREVERLKGLVEDAHDSGWRRGYSLYVSIEESMQDFKAKHNL